MTKIGSDERAQRAEGRGAGMSRKEDTARFYIQTPSAQADGVFFSAVALVVVQRTSREERARGNGHGRSSWQ